MTACRDRQRGAVTLMGALFIVVTLALMIEVLHRSAGTDLLDTAVQSSSVQALFLAESGLESTAARLAAGTCDASLSGTYNLGSGTFTVQDIGGAFNTDFSGGALPANHCRVRVSGAVPALGTQRVVEAIFQKQGNLLVSTNADFNDPPGACWGWWPIFCSVTGWSLPAGGWDDTGGPDGSRAAQVWKLFSGGSVATTSGSLALTAFTVTAPIDLTLTFDYRVTSSGGGGSNKANLDFGLWDGTTLYSSPTLPSNTTSGFVNGNVTIHIGGSGPVTLTEFRFSLEATAGQPKRIWLDNLDLQGPGGGGTISLLQWREVISN